MRRKGIHNERGIALILALVLALVVVGLAVGAIMLAGSTNLIGRFHVKDAEFRAAADAGIEWARDTINGNTTILPPLGFDTVQLRAPVRDASGNVVPGYTRSVFVGRSGATTGQFGVYASIIARIDDNAGRAVVVRRGELTQESFAKFARFDDTTTSGVVFRNGIQVFGPIHTNGVLLCRKQPEPAGDVPWSGDHGRHHQHGSERRVEAGVPRAGAEDQHAQPGGPGRAERLRHYRPDLAHRRRRRHDRIRPEHADRVRGGGRERRRRLRGR